MTTSSLPYGGSPPDSWAVVPLKYLTTLTNGYVFNSADWVDTGTPIIRIENLNGSRNFNHSGAMLPGRYRVEFGDLLFSWSGNPGTSFGPYLWTEPGDYYLNQHIFKMGVSGCDTRWLYWSLKAATHWIERELTSGMIGMVHVTKEELAAVPIPVPPIEQQRRIADFLDAETARIDRMTLVAERGCKLLVERRWATVHTLVTGSDRPVPRRNPGLGWVQQVPTSWPVIPLKFAARLGSGHTPSRSRPEYWQDCTIPWISLFDVGRMRDVRQTELAETTQQISELGMANSSACLHPAGTVVLSRTASVGFSMIMGVEMAVSQHFVTWTCGDSLLPTYLLQLLRAMRQYFESVQVGTTNVTVFMPDLHSIRIPLPPLAEQKAIVDRIDARTREIDALASRFDRQVSLLKERRQALITAAVTGQFDVSTASGRNVTDGVTA